MNEETPRKLDPYILTRQLLTANITRNLILTQTIYDIITEWKFTWNIPIWVFPWKKKREMKKREKRKEVSLQTWQNILILYFNNARIQEQNDLSQSF